MTPRDLCLAIGVPSLIAIFNTGIIVTLLLHFVNKLDARMDKLEGRTDKIEGKIDRLTEKVSSMFERLAAVEVRVAHLERPESLDRA